MVKIVVTNDCVSDRVMRIAAVQTFVTIFTWLANTNVGAFAATVYIFEAFILKIDSFLIKKYMCRCKRCPDGLFWRFRCFFVLQLQALNRFPGRVKYKQMRNIIATRSPEPTAYENLAKARWACASLASEKKKERKQKKPEQTPGNLVMEGQLSLVKENASLDLVDKIKKWVGCGRVNVLMANCDTFTFRFFALLSFWSENHTPYHIDWTKKIFQVGWTVREIPRSRYNHATT